MGTNVIPPPPAGFVLDSAPNTNVPPPPPGFVLDSAQTPQLRQAVPPPPEGFVLDSGASEQSAAPKVQPEVRSAAPSAAPQQASPTPAQDNGSFVDKIPLLGPALKQIEPVYQGAKDVAQNLYNGPTPEQQASTAAIERAGTRMDQSSAAGDLVAGWQSNPGNVGADLVKGTNFVKASKNNPENKAYLQFGKEAGEGMRRAAAKAIVAQATAEPGPVNPTFEALAKEQQVSPDLATSLRNYGTALATDPYGVMRTIGLRSIPQSWKSIVGGIAGSAMTKNPAGAALGAGAGSYDSEYNARIIDGITKFGGDITNEESILKTMEAHGDEIDKQARDGAAVTAFFDGAGALVQAKIAKLEVSGIPARTAQFAAGTVADAASGSAGSIGSQLAVDGKVSNWDDVFQEALGSLGTGPVTEGGMMAIEKAKTLFKAGRSMPTEDDLAKVFRETLPEEPISTYTEAVNSGRTKFAFIKDGETSAPVGTYAEAEARMGREDARTGKLIAVSPDEVQSRPSVFDANDVAAIAQEFQAFRDGDTATVDGFAKQIEWVLSKANSDMTLQQFINKAEESGIQLYDMNSTPTQIAQQLINVANGEVYVGDGAGKRITPKLENRVQLGSRAYDLDQLQSLAEKRGGFVIPTIQEEQLSANPEMIKRFDEALSFKDESARAQFIRGGETVRGQMLLEGTAKWNGRADPRFIGNGKYTKNSLVSYVTKDGIHTFSNSDMSLANVQLTEPDDVERLPQRQLAPWNFFYKSGYSKLVRNWAGEVSKLTVRHFGETPRTAWRRQLLEKWLKKFPINGHVMIVNIPIGANQFPILSQSEFEQTLVDQGMPKVIAEPTARAMYEMLGKSHWNAFMTSVGPDLHYVGVRDYPFGNSPVTMMGEVETLTHEFGHIISADKLYSAPLDTLLQIQAAYRRMRLGFDQNRIGWKNKFSLPLATDPIHQTGQPYSYVGQFEEWFAHQVTRWAFSQADTTFGLTRVLRDIGKKVVNFLRNAKENNRDVRAEPEVESYLNSMRNGTVQARYSDTLFAEVEAQIRKDNANAFGDDIEQAVPPYEDSSASIRAAVRTSMNGPFVSQDARMARRNANAAAATVDRWGWIYKWAANLRQLSEANPHIQELQLARELFNQVKIDQSKIHVMADVILQKWRELGPTRGAALSQFLFNLDQMTYRTPDEVSKGVVRWPTQDEFVAMAKELKLDNEAIAVYKEVKDFFLGSIKRMEELRLIDAMRITDPELQKQAIRSAKLDSIQLVKKPYFPQTRFGKYTLTVRNSTGAIEGFWLFETAREAKNVAADMMKNEFPTGEYTHVLSTLPEEVAPFVGMSPWMLDKIREMPNLKPEQLDWIDQLRYQMAPSQSFVKHMMRRKNIIGASNDGRRVFANYAFHHGRNYARVKYGSAFRDIIGSLRKSLPQGYEAPEISKRNAMADLVQHQVNELMNPSRDWAHLRALNAIWHLGFNVKSAVVNSTQIFVSTAFLGSKFGGVKAELAMAQASTRLSTYYKKGNLEALRQTDPEFRALDRAIKDGHIDESMAAELAALAIGGGVGQRIGKSLFGDTFLRGYINFTEKSMWMQRMTDQWQRRLCFRAAWKLAMENPSNKWVQSLKTKHAIQFETLIRENWTEREALAYIAGMDTSVQTQGTYDRQARPRYMQGRKSVLFAFQLFSQQNMWMLWNNKSMLPRYALYMLALGGLTGLIPDDLENLMEGVGKMALGKDFNLKRQAREFIVDLFGDKIPPDVILQGSARYGFGFPAVSEMVGAPFVPSFDLSGSMGIGAMVPIDPSKLGQPGAKATDVIASSTENIAGAAYGVPISIMKAVMNDQLDPMDFKRWEGALPAAMRNLSKAWRYYSQGSERTQGGALTTGFDGEDPEQLGEIIGIALGFRPTRQSQDYDRAQAERELDAFWTIQKQMLMRQAFRDKFIYKDEEAYKETLQQIREYNKRAVAKKYKITADSLIKSFMQRKKANTKIENDINTPPQVKSMVDRLYPETVQEKPIK